MVSAKEKNWSGSGPEFKVSADAEDSKKTFRALQISARVVAIHSVNRLYPGNGTQTVDKAPARRNLRMAKQSRRRS